MTFARKTPMKPGSGFKSKPGSPFSSFATPKARMKRTEMKKRAKRKPTVAEGSKYLAACRGEPCYLRVPSQCRRNPIDETIVPCHENSLSAGKGMGIKGDHRRTVPGCFWCHAWLDQGRGTLEENRLPSA